MNLRRSLLLTALLIGGARSDEAAAAFPTVALKPVVLQQIHSPTNITYAPDGSGRVFVCDQPGKIYIIQNGMMLPTPFLNIANPSNAVPNNGPGPVIQVGPGYNERGLLGMAFHPGFANPLSPGYRKFYLNYSKTYVAGTDAPPLGPGTPLPVSGYSVSVIAEFQASVGNPNVADPTSERRLLTFTQPQSNHNGGQLEFGPDGLLYIGSGDGGSSQDNNDGHTGGSAARPTNGLGNAQDKTRLFGKILRIDPLDPDGAGPLTYSIPATNPFVGAGGGVREEIYAFGLRNPWRFSFDKRAWGTDRLFCGDVGQGRIEEINLIVSGGNYGWRYLEGTENPTFSVGMAPPAGTLIGPIAMYGHSMPPNYSPPTGLPELGLSVTGGFVYRGSAIPALQGKYVFGDYGATSGTTNGRVMGLEETAPLSGIFTLTQAVPFINSTNPVVGQRILTLGEDESGEIYIGMKTTAGVLTLDDNGFPSGGIYKIVPLEPITATLNPSKDNTIFSEDSTPVSHTAYWPFTSDGQGYLYSGKTGLNYKDPVTLQPYRRRALVAFDLSAIPAGSTILSAQLQLLPTRIGPAGFGKTMALNRLTETWGEGASANAIEQGYGAAATTNDATWSRRFYNTSSWTTPGGTYDTSPSATPSATAIVPPNSQPYPPMTWGPTSQLISDVQGWLDTPASNAGWILIADETVNNTAVQFSSLQLGGSPPILKVTYPGAPPTTNFEIWLSTYYPTNRVGQYVDPNGDDDGDGLANQIEYGFGPGFSPVDAENRNNLSDGLNFSSAPAGGGGTNLDINFLRDTAATDLTYKLQTSSDLVTWTTIAQSTAGAVPVGVNSGLIIADDPYNGTSNLVTVREFLPAGSEDKKFVRLQMDRQ